MEIFCFVLVSNKNDKRIILRPGEVLCVGIALNNVTLTVTEKALASMSFSVKID